MMKRHVKMVTGRTIAADGSPKSTAVATKDQSVNQFICPEMQQTLNRTTREDATSANRCLRKQCL